MAEPAAIDVRGLREVLSGLRKIHDVDTPLAIKAANKDATQAVADEASRLAPKRTGRLAKSIKGRATMKRGYVVAGSRVRVPYAPVINFGGSVGPGKTSYIKPSLFMERARDNMTPVVLEQYRRALQEIGL